MKDIISKIKVFLTEDELLDEPTNLTDVKTADGVILSYEGDLAVGVEIFIVDEEGKVPAEGEFVLEDGTKLIVAEGKVTEIVAPEEPIEAPVEELPVEEMKTELSLEGLAEKITAIENDNLEIKTILTELAESFSKKEFEQEVKMSMEETKVPEKVELKMERKPLNQKNNDLNNIFKNMYK